MSRQRPFPRKKLDKPREMLTVAHLFQWREDKPQAFYLATISAVFTILFLVEVSSFYFNKNTMQSLYYIMFGVHRNGACVNCVIKGHFYKGITGKCTFPDHFPIIFL